MNIHHTGFIGTGRIARALITGLARKENVTLYGFDTSPAALGTITQDYPVEACMSIGNVAEKAEIIVLSVKPYHMASVLAQLKPHLTRKHLLVSVAAGMSSEFIRENTGESVRIIRVMPNTPAFVGEGMTALCRGEAATGSDLDIAVELFQAIGKTVVLDESLMDAATGLSGSGPAYLFHIIAALAEGGVRRGLSKEDALLMSAQTMYGAAKMVLAGNRSPEELISEVTTPGGTTEAGMKVLYERDISTVLFDTIEAATSRSRELMQ